MAFTDPLDRDQLVGQIISALTATAPLSRVELRGSISHGCADEYSDIDLRWTVPDDLFGSLDQPRAGL
jgi:predicted nucleotidyltransferase